jgi:cytoskeletal protein CcmA (bactofilin family)
MSTPATSVSSGSPTSNVPPPPGLPSRTGEIRSVGVQRYDAVRADHWTLEGSAKVLGEVDAGIVDLHGFVSIQGKVTADRFRSRGTLEVSGETRVLHDLWIDGTHRFSNNVAAGTLTCRGSVDVAGSVRVTGPLHLAGKLATLGEISAMRIEFAGRLESQGDWTAQVVIGKMKGACHAKAIRATTVRIVRGSLLGGRHAICIVDRIEAAEAYLENVECEFVRANRLTAGPGCHLSQVDGVILSRHPSSTIGFESRSPPPPGLSR